MVKYKVYLKYGYAPEIHTDIVCDNCGHVIDAGPNYKPHFCDMCGSPIKDDLDKVDWEYGECEWIDYVEYILDEHPDWPIKKVKYESTDWGKIGLPADAEHIPVMIGPDIETIINFVNEQTHRQYVADDFESATKNELIAHAKTCGKYWKG